MRAYQKNYLLNMNQHEFRSNINTITIKNYFYITNDLYLVSKKNKTILKQYRNDIKIPQKLLARM